ncbi:hypothetical protein R3P38DRAFT_3505636 [Favolaschia claudopus]|uniref:Gustatory receptor n=1 Tax=Favolaschia claudopus TaxID=2862362 RepID=A0AAV9Z1Y5_9AGAR
MTSQSLLVELQFVGYWLETLIYGIYLTTCVSCLRSLLLIHTGSEVRWRTRREVKWFFLVVGTSLFVVSTFHIIMGLLQTMQLFVGGNDHQNGLTDSSNGAEWFIVARNEFITQVIQSLLGDLVLVYRFISHRVHRSQHRSNSHPRCLIVYGPCWKLALPSILLYIADVAFAVSFIAGIILTLDGFRVATVPWLSAFGLTFFLVAALQNILTTCLLIWRIWKVDQQARKLGRISPPAPQRSLRHIIRVLAESGVCYTTMIILVFVVSVLNNAAMYPVSDVALQAAGIAFNFIIMQTAPSHERTAGPMEDGVQTSSLRFHVASTAE